MKLLILPGDGIGPEIVEAAVDVLAAVDAKHELSLEFHFQEMGLAALEKVGTTMPGAVLDAARQCDGIVLGPISHLDYPPPEEGGINVSAAIRIGFDLYANVRPNRSQRGETPEVDLVIIRENTEGFYADRNMFIGPGEFMPTPDVALAIRKVTAHASERIARVAFESALTRRHKVTAVHKANVLRVSDGLFLREVRKVAETFPSVVYDEVIIDAMAALLIRDASRFDIIVTTNMFGDILSDEAAELSGSLGLAGSLNVGDAMAAAQAQHGSAPDIAATDRANPTSLILSCAMLLDWWAKQTGRSRFRDGAASIRHAVEMLLSDRATRTADLGGSLGTRAFAAALISLLSS